MMHFLPCHLFVYNPVHCESCYLLKVSGYLNAPVVGNERLFRSRGSSWFLEEKIPNLFRRVQTHLTSGDCKNIKSVGL
jgi:hypothetical protein